MKARSVAVALFGLSMAACGSGSGAEPASPDYAFPSQAPPPPFASVTSGGLSLTGRLDGQLRGIDLAGETTDNSGTFERWEHGGSHTQLSIAAPGTPSGAGMLIVAFMGSALDDLLAAGAWTGSLDGDNVDGVGASTVVTSCAGPTLGDWPYEMPATSAEITATEEPERPGTVVLLVKGEFPASHLGPDASSELVGTFRFDRPE